MAFMSKSDRSFAWFLSYTLTFLPALAALSWLLWDAGTAFYLVILALLGGFLVAAFLRASEQIGWLMRFALVAALIVMTASAFFAKGAAEQREVCEKWAENPNCTYQKPGRVCSLRCLLSRN